MRQSGINYGCIDHSIVISPQTVGCDFPAAVGDEFVESNIANTTVDRIRDSDVCGDAKQRSGRTARTHLRRSLRSSAAEQMLRRGLRPGLR